HHEHHRIATRVFGVGLAQVEPVRAAEVARVRLPDRAQLADALLVALDLVERGVEGPGLERAALALGKQAQHAAAASDARLEAEERLERARSGALRVARRGALGVDF